MDKPIIESIKVVWQYDNDPDLSWLTQFENSNDPEEQKYAEQDRERLEAYNCGDWHMEGCYIKAIVSYSIGQGNRRLETFQSGGLWGIESDSEESYKRSVEKDELADLKTHLERFGVDTSSLDAKLQVA